MSRPDDPALADHAASWRAAYVHIPFCARVCPYCDFAVVAGRDHLTDRYIAAVTREIDSEPAWPDLSAIAIGGGTPSRIGATRLGNIVDALHDRFGIAADAEIGLEANPEDWTPALSEALVERGFTRVSFGAQSFDPLVLSDLGRLHSPGDIVTAVETARRSGFESVGLDLIFGSAAETEESWRGTVDAALDLAPDHLSLYALTVERGTALSRAVRAGSVVPPDPDAQANRWEWAVESGAQAGLIRYEVSNLARPGHACRYNLAVWAQGPYLAFGAGAHAHRDGIRRRNVRRIEAYIERVETGVGPVQASEAILGWAAEQERMMLGLRRAAGVHPGPGVSALAESDAGRRLIEAGVLSVSSQRLRIDRPLLTDEVIRAVLDLDDPAAIA